MRKATLLAMVLVLIAAVMPTQAFEEPLPMDKAFAPAFDKRNDGALVITWRIAKGYYLYRDYLAAEDDGGQALSLETEPGKVKDDPGFGTTEVYYERASAAVAEPPPKVRLTYQGCQDGGLCYPPTTKIIDVAAMTASVPAANSAVLPSSDATSGNGFSIASGRAPTAVNQLMRDGGLALLLAGFLGFGLLLAFTPCVFPMYPIVAAMLSREGSRLTAGKGFLLSATYGLALATAFGLLGMAAAWSGQNLQMALQSPFAIGTISALFIVLALSNFGLFHLQLPVALRNRFNSESGKGNSLGGAALLGFSSAFLIGPCVTAPLAGALLYIARTGDVLIGALALFALGLGKSLPLVIMLTAGGKALPRAGRWMETIRHVFGFIFLATAIWLATPLIPERFTLLPWAVLALVFGIYATGYEGLRPTGGYGVMLRSIAFISLLWGGLLFIGFSLGASDPLTPLGPLKGVAGTETNPPIEKTDFTKIGSSEALASHLKASSATNEPTLLYVTADWCVTCRAIERSVLKDREVQSALGGIRLASLDVTTPDQDRRALMQSLEVIGPPTMIFFDGAHREISGTRLIGDITTASLAESARTAKDALRR
ncbi:MAG: protein-disulfide reductase DsbD [Micropruina sp.]|uniref:protein-disulfide reductase DsbD n=1 Tax=Micropruina sp. TaxID=2737536 RepID=UPI0039E4F17F